jgi:hypothetical protein
LGRTEGRLPHRRHTVKQILATLRETEVSLNQGQAVAPVYRTLGVTEQTYSRWRNDYGRLTVDQGKCLNELEHEQSWLKRAVADFTLDTVILQEAKEGTCSASRADGRQCRTAVCRWAWQNIASIGCWGNYNLKGGRPMLRWR